MCCLRLTLEQNKAIISAGGFLSRLMICGEFKNPLYQLVCPTVVINPRDGNGSSPNVNNPDLEAFYMIPSVELEEGQLFPLINGNSTLEMGKISTMTKKMG